jgi:hypothetical protein
MMERLKELSLLFNIYLIMILVLWLTLQISGDTDVDPYPAADASEQFALPGFGDAANFSVFYENEKISARVAYNVTGEYFTGYDQYNPLFVTERSTVDFNATYNLNDNAAVFVEGINVTDEDVHFIQDMKK